jgi:hypothetical protein
MWYDLFGTVQERWLLLSPSMLQLNPFPSKQQKVNFVGSLGFLHHPQLPFNILSLTLHQRNYKLWKNYLFQYIDLEAFNEEN